MAVKIYLLLLALIMPNIAVAQSKRELKKQNSLLKHLKTLDDTYQIGKHKDIVFVLGVDDSDTATLTSLMTNFELESNQNESGCEIANDYNKISAQFSPTSKPIVPNLKINNCAEFGIAFYACPGFRDLSDAKDELTRLFVFRKLLNSAKSVKILVTIPYELLTNQQDFMALVINMTNTLNIEKYRDGIGLVVTNVPSTEDGKTDDNANANAIENIESILRQIKNDSIAVGHDNTDISEYTKKKTRFVLNFIDLLLEKHGENYSKIGIMLIDEADDSQHKITQLQNEKAAISKIVNINLVYIRKSNDDFVIHVSNANEDRTLDVIEELGNEMTAAFAVMSLDVKKFAVEQEKENRNNLTKLIDTFDSIYGSISGINPIELNELKKQLIDAANTGKVGLPHGIAKGFFKNIEIFTVMRSLVANRDTESKIRNEIMSQLSDLVAYLNNFKSFYNFLDNLRAKLSGYILHKRKSQIDGSRLMKLAINSVDAESTVFDLDIKSTIDSIDPDLYSQIEHLPINTIKLNQLQGLWNQSMIPVSKHCSKDSKSLTVIGYNVAVTDLFDAICWPNATSIEILALNKIFFDQHLEKSSANLSIIAPEWEIVSTDGLSFQQINVNGERGYCGDYFHRNPKDTYDGGPGGHFFGVGQKINENSRLKIDVAGGQGINILHIN